MTVNTTVNYVIYQGNDVTDAFAFPFLVLDEDHLVVTRRVADTLEVDHVYTGSEYTVTGIDTTSGQVTLTGGPLASGYEILIQRIVPYTQAVDIVNQGGFHPDVVEEQLDLTTMGLQQIADETSRSIKVPAGETLSELPAADDRAGKFVAFDANGDPVVTDGTGPDGSLRADLASAGGALLIGTLANGTGTVTRALQAWLNASAIYVEDYGALDPTGTLDNTSYFAAAYADALAAGKPLELPSGGIYKTTGLAWEERGVSVRGNGCTFIPAANNQSYVISLDGGSPYDRPSMTDFGNFNIKLTGYTGCTGLKTSYMVSGHVHHVSIYANEYPAMAGNNIGWRSIADQYSCFEHIDVMRVSYGAYLTSDVAAGGGINCGINDIRISYCKVGMMLINVSVYPMGIISMNQCILQASTHCAFYAYNVQQLRIIGMPPEQCSGSGTITVDGYTIKAGHIHADQNCQITFPDYNHVSNDATMVIRAENKSHLRFEGACGAAVNTYCDRTSTIVWDGSWGNASVFRFTQFLGRKIETNRAVSATMYPEMAVDPSFPTAADTGNAITGPLAGGAGFTTAPVINGDDNMVAYQSMTFGAGVGALGSNFASILLTSGSTLDRTKAHAAAVLLRSSVDADYIIYFSNIVQNQTVSLRAGEWVRVVLYEHPGTVGNSQGYFYIWPVAAGAPTLDLAYPTLISDPSSYNVTRFLREHVVNPRNSKGLVYEAAAAPTTGSWPRGALVWNSAPTAGGVPGWECVTAGTPGTWKAMAALAV